MTSDDLPARLERSAEFEKLIKVTDENTRDISAWFNRLAVDARKAAARIRELEAELDALKSDLSGYMSAANTYVNELHGVHAGTHTIVPVEPTPEMIGVGKSAFDLDLNAHNLVTVLYRAMIRAAAQENADETE